MKKIFGLLIIVTFLLGCGCSAPQISSNNKTNFKDDIGYYNLKKSTVMIAKRSSEDNSLTKHCTGFFVSKDVLITAAHCVAPLKLKIIKRNGKIGIIKVPDLNKKLIGKTMPFVIHKHYKNFSLSPKFDKLVYYEANVIATNKDKDIAILRAKPGYEHKHHLKTRVREPYIGENAYTMGMPLGNVWVLTKGIVNKKYPKRGAFGVTAHTYPGSSGSPVVDSQGNVIGISIALYKVSTMGIATSTKHIHNLVFNSDKVQLSQ